MYGVGGLLQQVFTAEHLGRDGPGLFTTEADDTDGTHPGRSG